MAPPERKRTAIGGIALFRPVGLLHVRWAFLAPRPAQRPRLFSQTAGLHNRLHDQPSFNRQKSDVGSAVVIKQGAAQMRLFVGIVAVGLVLLIAKSAPANAQTYICNQCGTTSYMGCWTEPVCLAAGGCSTFAACTPQAKRKGHRKHSRS